MPSAVPDKRIALAAIAGAHGVKGEVRLKLFSDGVDSLASHAALFVGGIERRLRSVRAGKAPVASFEGIDDRDSAEALRGTLIEVERAALPSLEEGEYYHADLIGLPCRTAAGEPIGTVAGVENYGAGDLLDVALDSGAKALIPFRDGIADLVDGRIVLDPQFLA